MVLTSGLFAASKADLSYRFQCSSELNKGTCERQLELVREIVERQHAALPAGWSWLVVADSDWPTLQRRYHLKHDFAFTHMGERRTVINSLLFQRFGQPVWEWAIAHESAHVVCDLVDDKMADRVAEELMSGGFLRETCRQFTPKGSGN